VVYDITKNTIAIDSNNNGSSNYYGLTNLPGNWDCEENPILFNNQYETAKFLFKSILTPDDADIIRGNDTAYTTQVFDKYYSYDDGSAENAYGIDAAYAMVAYKFSIYQGDSLRALNMYFLQNKPLDGAAYNFVACVWKADNNGLPGKLIVEKEVDRPQFGSEINQFVTIDLDTAVFIEKEEVFFIGWQQNSDLRMNVGWDINTDYTNQNHLYYNITGDWVPSKISGSLMLRPVFSQNPLSSVSEHNSQASNFKLYPNPAKDFFTIDGIEPGTANKICIYNALGRLVCQTACTDSGIDISNLAIGIYLVTIQSGNAPVKTIKLIKTQ
jgi:hypothetical protein